ncbi:hypothetical protein GQ54DRAFT_69618 [Martensiomyces pterosporus]|nr:hypothetical protein GQ54DRAFT_84440 [Martensiomyces pterosporus]KAI8318681.1 hypothetical protein GQ54DRAFT_69618 [Martensiomyces pterosporus]
MKEAMEMPLLQASIYLFCQVPAPLSRPKPVSGCYLLGRRGQAAHQRCLISPAKITPSTELPVPGDVQGTGGDFAGACCRA